MREVRVQDAIGTMLGHDMTRIVPGESKGRQFKRGHVIRAEDVEMLLSMGKEHIYVLDVPEGHVHEEEAAERLARAAGGPGVEYSPPSEGRVNLIAAHDGLLKVDRGLVDAFNAIEPIIIATIPGDRPVRKGAVIAGTRVVPLTVEADRIARAEAAARAAAGPMVQVKPFRPLRAGVVITGSEILHGRVEDRFGPVVRRKLAAYGSTVIRAEMSGDDADHIAALIREFAGAGAELVLCTGGMSVDPDDRTPGGMRRSGAQIVTHGAPVLPGSMFAVGYLGDVPVLGLPGCVLYDRVTLFDVLLPRLHAGERITRADIVSLGYGGILPQDRDWF